MNSTPYSRLDRALHNVAFRSSMLQNLLEDIETTFFAKTWEEIPVKKPIFITSLPRAGTTIILEALHRLPGTATHTYRDMPFIFTPVLWNKLSGSIRKKSILRERAHGDGLVISEDSPEAFEEVLWLRFFPEYYSDSGINLWSATNRSFTNYFHQHIQKIISLRRPQDLNCRYLSKNNCNIARIKTIKEIFPDSFIIIPLRNPVEHAISLWRQHNNFIELHSRDDFARKYMADIGHYEFGILHRPIEFPGFHSLTAGLDPGSINYWIAYWVSAFDHLSQQNGIAFISYEELCLSPAQGLGELCQQIELQAKTDEIASSASIIKPPPANRKPEHSVESALSNRAYILHQQLLARCLLRN